MSTREFDTVYTVKDAVQAEIIRGALHGEGIACQIEGEGQAGLSGIMDIKIKVPVEDLDRAKRLIESHMAGERE
jgi:hypothetical protein